MAQCQLYIRSLERFLQRQGARLRRDALPECVHARIISDAITLRADLSPEQELSALVHELAHWLSHLHPALELSRTVCEYEAEAVEQWVLGRIGLQAHDADASPTDNLLPASVVRVRDASHRICGALGLEPV